MILERPRAAASHAAPKITGHCRARDVTAPEAPRIRSAAETGSRSAAGPPRRYRRRSPGAALHHVPAGAAGDGVRPLAAQPHLGARAAGEGDGARSAHRPAGASAKALGLPLAAVPGRLPGSTVPRRSAGSPAGASPLREAAAASGARDRRGRAPSRLEADQRHGVGPPGPGRDGARQRPGRRRERAERSIETARTLRVEPRHPDRVVGHPGPAEPCRVSRAIPPIVAGQAQSEDWSGEAARFPAVGALERRAGAAVRAVLPPSTRQTEGLAASSIARVPGSAGTESAADRLVPSPPGSRQTRTVGDRAAAALHGRTPGTRPGSARPAARDARIRPCRHGRRSSGRPGGPRDRILAAGTTSGPNASPVSPPVVAGPGEARIGVRAERAPLQPDHPVAGRARPLVHRDAATAPRRHGRRRPARDTGFDAHLRHRQIGGWPAPRAVDLRPRRGRAGRRRIAARGEEIDAPAHCHRGQPNAIAVEIDPRRTARTAAAIFPPSPGSKIGGPQPVPDGTASRTAPIEALPAGSARAAGRVAVSRSREARLRPLTRNRRPPGGRPRSRWCKAAPVAQVRARGAPDRGRDRACSRRRHPRTWRRPPCCRPPERHCGRAPRRAAAR